MGLDKLKKKKKPHQLVSKRKDGKRPGYYGPDAGHANDPGSSANDSGGGGGDGGGDDYMNYYYSPPAPAPTPAPAPEPEYDTADFAFTTPTVSYSEPDTSGDDQEEDVAQMMVDMGLTPDNAPTISTLPDPEDEDSGDNLYVTPAETIEINPVDEFGIKGNVYADTGFTPVSGQNITYDTFASLPAPEPKGFFDSGIGKLIKTTATVAAPFVAAPIAGLVGGKTAFDTVNLGMRARNAYNLASRYAPKTTRRMAEAFTTFQGTGNKVLGTGNGRPNTATGYESGGDDRPIPKDVITANVQKFSPAQINSLQSNIALLESVLDSGQYRGTKLNSSQLSKVSNQRNSLLEQYNMIQEYLV